MVFITNYELDWNPNKGDSKLTPGHFCKGLLEQLGCGAKFCRNDNQAAAIPSNLRLVRILARALMAYYCTGKEALLSRAFSNVIENAIRYNRAGGEVAIVFDERSDGILVIIRDTGIGMAQEELSHIFEAFYRIERSRSRHYGGAGLGLAITALILKGHGGTITAESTPGKGSSFRIELPNSRGVLQRTSSAQF